MKAILWVIGIVYVLPLVMVSWMCVRAYILYWSEPSQHPSLREWLEERYPVLWKRYEGAQAGDSVLTFLATPGVELLRMLFRMDDHWLRVLGTTRAEADREHQKNVGIEK